MLKKADNEDLGSKFWVSLGDIRGFVMRKASFNRSFSPVAGILLSVVMSGGTLPGLAVAAPQTFAQNSQPAIPIPLTPDASSVQLDPGYVLGAGDRLGVDIFGLPDYSTKETQVLADGSLNLPLVGNLSVKGLNVKQLTSTLTQRYSRFIRRPIVTVSVLAPRPVKVAIAGEVMRPGSYTVENAKVITVTGAIQLAEGLRQSADLSKIQVRRTATAGGQVQLLDINLLKLIDTGDTEQDPLLRDGDTVFIPATTTFDLAQGTKIATSSFVSQSTNPVRVAVNGEVFRPGPYALTGGTQGTVSSGQGTTGQVSGGGTGGKGVLPTLTKAIQEAGGITESADIRQIQLTRKTATGTLTTKVNFIDVLSSGDVAQDIPLQDGDVITVPVATAISPEDYKALTTASIAPATITVNVVGEVERPGALKVPPNTPLNQALLTAGGFSDRAAKGKVELIRLNPNNGTVNRQEIPVDLAKGIDSEQNPILRNNDTVIVAKSNIARAGSRIGQFTGPLFPVFSLLRLFGVPLP